MKKYLDNKAFLFLLILPFFTPTAFQFIPSLTLLYEVIQYWKLLAIFVVVFFYVFNYRFSKIIRAIVIFEALTIITSLINGVSLVQPLKKALLAVGMSMLTEMAIKNNFDAFRNTYFTISFITVILNFVLCLFYPEGLPSASLYTNGLNPLYLLAIDNGIIKVLLPFLVFSCYPYCKVKCLNINKSGTKSIFFFCCIISLWTLSIVASATGLIVCAIYVLASFVFMLLPNKRLPVKLILFLIALFMIFVVVIGSNFGLMDSIMEIFGRSGTFTGRTTLWRLAIEEIVEKPLFGYGYTSGNIAIWDGLFSSHNIFLEITIQGGLVTLVAFLYLIVIAFKNLKKAATPYFNLVALGLICFLLVGLMETGVAEFFYILLVMAYNPVLPNDKKATETNTVKITDGMKTLQREKA